MEWCDNYLLHGQSVATANLPGLLRLMTESEILDQRKEGEETVQRARNWLAQAEKDSEGSHSQRGTLLVSWVAPCYSQTKHMHLGLGPGCQGNCCSSCLGPCS